MKKPEYAVKNVVLIDDSKIDNMIHCNLLERSAFSEGIAAYDSSVKALEEIRKMANRGVENTGLPDYIFLDISMPVMDSYGFLDEYEKLDYNIRRECKVVILTSSINPQDEKDSLMRESVVGYISKPLTLQALSRL